MHRWGCAVLRKRRPVQLSFAYTSASVLKSLAQLFLQKPGDVTSSGAAPATVTRTTWDSDPISDVRTGKKRKVTYVNPYTWDSESARASSKAKKPSKGRSKCHPTGMTIMDGTIKKLEKLGDGWRKENQEREVVFLSGCKLHVRDVASLTPITEQPFGTLYTPENGDLCGLSGKIASELSSSVVALALFDGNVMLFACTGLALPYKTVQLQRFLTSAYLVEFFNAKRNTEDNLNIRVCLPDNKIINGFVELYDKDIAIITSFTLTCVDPVDLNAYAPAYPAVDVVPIVAAGRSFGLCGFMATRGKLIRESEISDCCITEAALGGPIVDLDGKFLGMSVRCGSGIKRFIPQHVILQRLYQFRLLECNPGNVQGGDYATKERIDDPNPHGAGSSAGGTKTIRQVRSMPLGAMKIKPSGFLRKLDVLTRLGYPEPPPLMLELNGELINMFEEDFGYLNAWSRYPYNLDVCGDGMNAWARLDAATIKTISRRVVSLSSYNGGIRFFSCTGLIIEYTANTDSGSHRRTVILTSASLARVADEPDTIDKNLKIEVFLPPKQRAIGTLESYDSHHNIAIVSFKGLRAIGAEDIFNLESSKLKPKHVVAVGREPEEGLLCASTGKLTNEPVTTLPCKHLKLSTCKIKKAGIGGPLVNFNNGSFIGMNFCDGKSRGTPFLPRRKIVEVLNGMELVSPRVKQKGGEHKAAILDDRAETNNTKRVKQKGGEHKAAILDDRAETNNTKRWPVPQAYWWSDVLEMDWAQGQKFVKHRCCDCDQCLSWLQTSADLEATGVPSPSVTHVHPSESAMDPEATTAPIPLGERVYAGVRVNR